MRRRTYRLAYAAAWLAGTPIVILAARRRVPSSVMERWLREILKSTDAELVRRMSRREKS